MDVLRKSVQRILEDKAVGKALAKRFGGKVKFGEVPPLRMVVNGKAIVFRKAVPANTRLW